MYISRNQLQASFCVAKKFSDSPGASGSNNIVDDTHADGRIAMTMMLKNSRALFILVNLNIFPRARRFLQTIKKKREKKIAIVRMCDVMHV